MAHLEIQFLDGDTETRQLSRSQPLSIGSHATNDVCISEEGVATMYCRISWNRSTFEVASANPDGVELNGRLVKKAVLSPGDTLRIGSVDVVFRDESAAVDASAKVDSESADVGLVPISDDAIPVLKKPPTSTPPAEATKPKPSGAPADRSSQRVKRPQTAAAAPAATRPAAQPAAKPRPPRQSEPETVPPALVIDDDEENRRGATSSNEELYLALIEDSDTDQEAVPVAATTLPPRRTVGGQDSPPPDQPMLTRPRTTQEGVPPAEAAASQPQLSLREQVRTLRRGKRPGERDSLRSPLVLGLGGGAAVLSLVAAVFYFLIGRETVERQFEHAQGLLAQAQFKQAIDELEKFIGRFPRHPTAEQARFLLGQAQVEQSITGAEPEWKRGLERLTSFIDTTRELPRFPEQHERLREYAEKISRGAAESAGRVQPADGHELLKTARDALGLLHRYSAQDAPPDEADAAIKQLLLKSEATILRKEIFADHLQQIDTAVAAKKPMEALDIRRRLIERYEGFRSDKAVEQRLQQTLDTEQGLIQSEELNRAAVTTPRDAAAARPLSLVEHIRSRTDEDSVGRSVYVLAKGCVLGIDTVTGNPVWRRIVGLNTPFMPLEVASGVPGLLLFDTTHHELLLVDRAKGSLIWRVTLDDDEQLSGPPLVHEGQIYAVTTKHRLYQIGLETGQLGVRLTFSQKIHAPPVLVADGQHLLVAGDMQVAYGLSLRPLACVSVSNFGHKPGSLKGPLISMGRLVLMPDNDRQASCRLRIIDTAGIDKRLTELAAPDGTGDVRLDGQVVDPPVLRGPKLFVPSGGEQLAVFTVSDDPAQRALTPGPRHPGDKTYSGPMFLTAGPDDQLWLASGALYRLQATTESIKLDANRIAVGQASQPLQSIGRNLFVGRTAPHMGAVIFTQVDREAVPTMTSQWRTVVGAKLLAWTSRGETAFALTEAGDLFRVTAQALAAGGFSQQVDARLKLPDDLADPLRGVTLPDGRLVAAVGGSQPQIWLISAEGQVQRTVRLKQPVETDPVPLDSGVVAAQPGRLSLVAQEGGQPKVDDLVTEAGGKVTRHWKWLAALDAERIVGVDDAGTLTKVQLRKQPQPHLRAEQTLELGAPVDVPPAAGGGLIAVADAGGRLRLLQAADLQTVAEVKLDAAASNALWLTGQRLFVETGRQKLHCFDASGKLTPIWRVPLEVSPLAGPPLELDGQLILATREGEILRVDAKTGEVAGRQSLEQPLNLGPRRFGQDVVVTSIDGSLHRVVPVKEASK